MKALLDSCIVMDPLQNREPFVVDMSKLTAQELDEELEKGYQDVLAGRTKPASKVFDEIRTDYDI